MSQHDYEHEDDLNAIPEGEESEDYARAQAESEAEEKAAAEKSRKDKMFKGVVFGVAALGLAGVFGYKFLNQPPPKPQQAPGALATLNAPAPAPAPAPVDPAFAPPAGVDPALAAPAGMDPALAAQTPVGVDPAMAAQAPVGVDPALGAAPAPIGAPAGAAPAIAPAVGATAPEGVARGFDEIGQKLDELKGMFGKFEDMKIDERLSKLERLEARVAALEGKPASAKAKASSSNARRYAAKPNYKAPAKSSNEESMFVRLADGSQTAPAVARGRDYKLQAVIPGLFWIKKADQSSQTFEVGQTLPDGAKILKIDPDRFEVVTNQGVLR